MGTLVYICPINGEEVSTGIDLDLATFARLPIDKSVRCPRCQQLHQLGTLSAWIDHTGDDLPDKAA